MEIKQIIDKESIESIESIRSKTSNIDRIDKIDKKSIQVTDYEVSKIYKQLNDVTLERPYIQHAIRRLGFAKVLSITDYVCKKANNPGRAFIGLCQKEIK